tara:strand:+ start:94 stop:501 length:408 start_codon:yes stop_codon:yes gene_type:complete
MEKDMIKPNLFRRTTMWVVNSWRYVMDIRYNPLKYVPDPSLQAYFMLVLFTIWSLFFGMIAIYYLGFVNYSIVNSIIVHSSIIIPIVITNAVFVDAERDGHKWLAEWKEEQSKYKLFLNRTRSGVRIMWDIDKEA